MKESTSYECYTYIESGQADDYKAQMEERLSLLRNPELKNVFLGVVGGSPPAERRSLCKKIVPLVGLFYINS